MKEIVRSVFQIYSNYTGSSLALLLFLCAIVYLWLTEGDEAKRPVLVYGSALLVVLFFCPLFSWVMINKIFDNEVYYRFFWLLPINVVIAYTGTRVFETLNSIREKIIILFVISGFIIVSGTYTYNNPLIQKAENNYHIPQEVIDVCEVIVPTENEEWICALVPSELLSYVRQYSTMIHMPYGRAVLIDRWNLGHPLFDIMESEIIPVEKLANVAREYGCHYIVLSEEKSLTGNLDEYDYIKVASVAGYNIYLDKYNNREIPVIKEE